MAEAILTSQPEDGILVVTLNRPQALNALDVPAKERLGQIWKDAAHDSAVRVIVLHGAGDRGFCAGSDIKEMRRTGRMVTTEALMAAIPGVATPLEKPTIAALHGFTVGFGLTLAIHCDFRVAARDSRMGFPEVQHGMLSGISAITLPGLIGEARALDLMLTGRLLPGEEALALGLINQLSDDAFEDALKLARMLAGTSSLALQLTKRLVLESRRARITAFAETVDQAREEVTRSREFSDVVENRAGTGRARQN